MNILSPETQTHTRTERERWHTPLENKRWEVTTTKIKGEGQTCDGENDDK